MEGQCERHVRSWEENRVFERTISTKLLSLKFSLMEILLQSPGNKSIRTNIRTKKLRSIGEDSSIKVKRVVTGV